MMANQMFGGGFISSRLANRLRQQDGLSYGARSFLTVDPLMRMRLLVHTPSVRLKIWTELR